MISRRPVLGPHPAAAGQDKRRPSGCTCIKEMTALNRSKSCYKIRLYRSWRFYLLCAVLFALAGFHLAYNFYLLAGGELHGLLSAEARAGYTASQMPAITGILVEVGLVLTQLELLFEIVYTAIGLFGNRLYVREDDTRIYFAPRLFSRVSKRDICKIEPVSVENLGFWERLSSFNFDKKYLYRFTCYDTVLLLSSKDEAGMAKLAADIRARCNKTEEEETGTNNALGDKMAWFFTWKEIPFCWIGAHAVSVLLLIVGR